MFKSKFEELMLSNDLPAKLELDAKLESKDSQYIDQWASSHQDDSVCHASESKLESFSSDPIDEKVDAKCRQSDCKGDQDSPEGKEVSDMKIGQGDSECTDSHNPVFTQPNVMFMVGDVVKAKLGFMMFEGVVVGNGDANTLDVDFGDEVEQVPRTDCSLVISGLEFEVGDLVSACPNGSMLFFNGTIVEIHLDGTCDVLFDGDDEEDVERGIRLECIRKIRTGRQLVVSRWQKAKNLLTATRAFADLSSSNS